ncbi:MAG: FixH family protein [Pseudonocardiaceae bacterium]
MLAGICLLAVSACGGVTSAQGETESCAQDQKTAPVTVHLDLSPCPVLAGQASTAIVTLEDGSGGTIRNAEVTVHSAMPAMKMTGGSFKAEEKADGYHTNVILGMSGPWDLSITVSGAGAPSQTHFTVYAR